LDESSDGGKTLTNQSNHPFAPLSECCPAAICGAPQGRNASGHRRRSRFFGNHVVAVATLINVIAVINGFRKEC